MATENMQTWEYCTIEFSAGKAWRVNNAQLPKPWPAIFEYINHLGKEGWELAGFDTTGFYIFKRPR